MQPKQPAYMFGPLGDDQPQRTLTPATSASPERRAGSQRTPLRTGDFPASLEERAAATSRMRIPLVLLLLFGLLGFSPVSEASEPEVLYSQLDNATSINAGGGFQPLEFIVDDFTVPEGTQWTLMQFSFITGGSLTTVFPPPYTLVMYQDNATDPTLPGAQISVQSIAAAGIVIVGNQVTMTLPEPMVLQPGGYWIGVDGYLINVRTPPTGQRAARLVSGNFVPVGTVFTTEPLDLRFTLIGTTQTLATPAAIIETFDELAGSGGLTAAGPGKSAPNRFEALRSMLVTASALFDSGDIAGACRQLDSASKRVHTQGKATASHFASGESAAELVTAIADVRSVLCT